MNVKDVKLDREVVFSALVGSHNYNLNHKDSDKDYKIFVYPTFDDLYDKEMYHTKSITPDLDYEVHDIRKLPYLLYAANLNYLEILFSEEVKSNNAPLTRCIWNFKDDIVTMNIPKMFDACVGSANEKYKHLDGTAGTQHLVEAYGYDTKQAMHCYRNLDFLTKFHNHGFIDFAEILRYNGRDREFMFSILNGAFTEAEFKEMIDNKIVQVNELKEDYKSFTVDDELYAWLIDLVKTSIRSIL